MDKRSLEMYKKALRDGQEKVYNIRVMVVGQYGVGKTTLTRRLLGKDVKISDRKSTEGIETHIECCKVSLTTGEWITQEKNVEQYSRLQRLVKLLSERVQKQESESEQVRQSEMEDQVVSEEHDNGHSQHDQPVSEEQDVDQEVKPTSSQPVESPIVIMGPEASNEVKSTENEKKKDAVMEILQLVNENSDKLKKSMLEYAALALWDFAGQYVFYTTHQTFLTSRAIYLLVLDLSQQVEELIKDDKCYRDMEGIKPCKVHDLIEIWLNSIHSCAPSPQAGTPPVILVGTHVDKIPEKSRQNVISQYFMKIRKMLKDKPIVLHLMDSIAIDNTQYDPNLEDLKKRIFELASKQPYWGEEKPARWLPLEQRIMTLKAFGVKVVPLSLIEEINRSGSVKIECRDEFIAFLSFQHEMGTILYFSVDGLSEKIVLDPQWMIDALKSLITAEMFIIKKPAITSMWCDFRDNGKLTHELLDALWTEEENPEFHHNKNHILLLMERLNIITKPRSYSEDGKEIKVENYFLAPCMLQQNTPIEIISPEPHHERESTSVLCYVFKEKFLPSPIFHRLLAACLTRWSIAKKKSDNLIFCGCCILEIDPCHKLTLFLRDYVIFARVARISSKNKTPDLKICIDVRDFIKENLFKIIGSLCHNLEFELHIQCSKSEKDCLNSTFPVSKLQENEELVCSFHDNDHPVVSHDLLRFWFEDEESQGKDGEDNAFSLLPDMLDRKPSERKLSRLSLRIGNEFYLLGLHLGLCSANIQQIQMDNQHTVTQCLMILVKWREKSGDKATFRNLEIAFKGVGIDIDILNSLVPTGDRVSCLPQTILDKQPEDRHLIQICDRIGKEYVHLGVELGVPVSKIEQIRIQHSSNVSGQCFEIMREWKEKKAMQATFRNLEKAVKCSGIDPSILIQCVK